MKKKIKPVHIIKSITVRKTRFFMVSDDLQYKRPYNKAGVEILKRKARFPITLLKDFS